VWQNGYRPANKVTYACGLTHFSQSASTLKSGDTGLTLNFWQSVIKERQGNILQATLSEISRQTGRM
jgi:hypothetical protein